MKLPKRRHKNSGRDGKLRNPGHLRFIRGFECSVTSSDFHGGKIEAAHVRIGTDGSMSVKPSDNWTIPLCGLHHNRQHMIGEATFEKEYGIDMKAIAEALWARSPHRKRVA